MLFVTYRHVARTVSVLVAFAALCVMLLWRGTPLIRTLTPAIFNPSTIPGQIRHAANNLNMIGPKIISAEELPASEAKCV